MLSIDRMTFTYANEPVLRQLSLCLEAGMVHGILGPNGSGKTTLLDILAGRLKPGAGTVRLNDNQLSHSDIAYMETDPHFYPMITGAEYLHLYSRQNPRFDVGRWNALFELPLDALIESYSSGMIKKLALMGIIALERPVVLLDEPFNNLDVEANRFLARLLKLLAEKGKLVLLTSHLLEILTGLADTVHVLNEGVIEETVRGADFEQWKETYRAREINDKIDAARELL